MLFCQTIYYNINYLFSSVSTTSLCCNSIQEINNNKLLYSVALKKPSTTEYIYWNSWKQTKEFQIPFIHNENNINIWINNILNHTKQKWTSVIAYNDAPPSNFTTPSIYYGHCKGILVWNADKIGWLIHSVPKFPISIELEEFTENKQKTINKGIQITEIEKESELKSQFRQEEIRKEKYLKEKNLNVLSNLKSAIDNSAEIYKTENEKLVQAKSQVTTLEIDLNQLNSAIKDQQALIKSLRESADNCITQEKFLEALCPKCIARARGISFISPINAFQSEKDHESKACSRCRII